MPAKRKTLPYPCPICGEICGTVRIEVFRPGSPKDCYFHMRHHDRRKYAESVKAIAANRMLEPQIQAHYDYSNQERKKKPNLTRPSGRVEHDFQTEYQLDKIKVKIEDRIFNLCDLPSLLGRKSVRVKLNANLIRQIREKGWQSTATIRPLQTGS